MNMYNFLQTFWPYCNTNINLVQSYKKLFLNLFSKAQHCPFKKITGLFTYVLALVTCIRVLVNFVEDQNVTLWPSS